MLQVLNMEGKVDETCITVLVINLNGRERDHRVDPGVDG
jgi:hypothetical protein